MVEIELVEFDISPFRKERIRPHWGRLSGECQSVEFCEGKFLNADFEYEDVKYYYFLYPNDWQFRGYVTHYVPDGKYYNKLI